MTKQKTTKADIENSLGEARETLSEIRDALGEPSQTRLEDVATFLETLDGVLLDIDKADQEIALALSTLEDANLVDDEQDHTEHVMRALKHLGVQDLDVFTDTDVKMALEQTVGL